MDTVLDQWRCAMRVPTRYLLALCACRLLAAHAAPEVTAVSYSPSSAIITNPERGLYTQIACNGVISQGTYASWRASGTTLTLCYFNLASYVNAPIGQSALDTFQTQMDNMRAAGIKAIVRFTYNQSDSGTDAALPQLNAHMDQLAPYLSRNKDVIAVVQGGFIGSWGEYANSQHYGQIQALSAQNIADRAAVMAKQLATTPPERQVQIRFPRSKVALYGSAPLSATEAFNGTAKSRVAHHNDCFLSTSTDWGTYGNTSTEYPYLAADSNYLAVGGETCKVNSPRSDCPTALQEMAKFHWSYLHQGYHLEVLDNWRAKDCFTQIQQRLGYRFVLQNGTYPMSAKPGGAFAANFTIKNEGWAAPFNARDVELVFRNTATGALYRSKLNADPRKWLSGQTVTVSQNVVLPADMGTGNYTVLLNLPDPMSSLRNRPEYAIQLANSATWEAGTGLNNLHHTVMVLPEVD